MLCPVYKLNDKMDKVKLFCNQLSCHSYSKKYVKTLTFASLLRIIESLDNQSITLPCSFPFLFLFSMVLFYFESFFKKYHKMATIAALYLLTVLCNYLLSNRSG